MSGNGGNPHSLRDLLGTYEKSGLGLDDDYFIVDFHTTEDLVDKTIGEVINGEPVEALVVKRMKDAHPHPDHSWKIRKGDRIVLGGQLEDLRDLVNRL